MAEYHSFSVRAPHGAALPAGRSKSRYIYGQMMQDHLLTLPARSSWTGTYDLTDLFAVSNTDTYNVSFTSTLTAVSNPTTRADPYPITVISNSQLINLTSSPCPTSIRRSSTRTKVRRDDIQNCDAGTIWVIRQAVASATAMASVAVQWTPTTGATPSYSKYLNDNPELQVVRKVFKYIASYKIDSNNGFTWYCNVDPESSTHCQNNPYMYGYAPPVGDSRRYVTLRPYYFTSTWASSICKAPGASNLGIPGNWQRPDDQTSIIMHDLLHDAGLPGLQGINDGPDPKAQNQYSYDQVTALAVNASANDELMSNSPNFVFFKLAVRNQTTTPAQDCVYCPLQPPAETCSQSPGSPPCQKCAMP